MPWVAALLVGPVLQAAASSSGAACAAYGASVPEGPRGEPPCGESDEASLLQVTLAETRRAERFKPGRGDGIGALESGRILPIQRPFDLRRVTAAVPPAKQQNASTGERLAPLPPFPTMSPPQLSPSDDRWRVKRQNHSSSRAVWNRLRHIGRHHKWANKAHPPAGPLHFFRSAEFIDWAFLILAAFFFFEMHVRLMDWPSTRRWHATALIIWLCVALFYNFVVWTRLGADQGKDWLIGYMLEFIFSIENVFIYHVVTKAFNMPRSIAQKALAIVVVCQVLFQAVFFMGLAHILKSIIVLPYIVGAWLLYVAYHTLGEEEDEADVNKSRANLDEPLNEMPAPARYFESMFGDRFIPNYKDKSVLVWRKDVLCVSMLAPAVLSLLLVCFVMEVDVTLTKIEEIPNHFVAFTSSMAAAFAVPEIFFVARDLFDYFRFLKFGITFVLLFFGLQLLLHRFIDIPDMVGLLIIILVMIFCMLLSTVVSEPEHVVQKRLAQVESETETEDMSRRTSVISSAI